MKIIRIPLDEQDENIYLTAYLSDVRNPLRDAMLIFPGGAYANVCDDREGEPIALAFLSRGYHAFVLHYSVYPKDPYQPLMQASLAMKWIKEHDVEYGIDKSRVFTVGFSAGGHLCASLGTLWHDPVLNQKVDMPFGINKPDGMILCYPVISAYGGHTASHINLLGNTYESIEMRDKFSLEKQVRDDTCPAFLVHTSNDDCVPVVNTLMMGKALSEHHILFEMYIVPNGPHGLALGDKTTSEDNPLYINEEFSRWVDYACAWLKTL